MSETQYTHKSIKRINNKHNKTEDFISWNVSSIKGHVMTDIRPGCEVPLGGESASVGHLGKLPFL